MEKLPKVRVPAARAVIVNNIPALKATYDNYKVRLKPGMELSFWCPASFSTKDDVVNREEFVGGPNEPAIVYMCGVLEGVDMEPFKPRGLRPEYEVLPLCPLVCRVVAAGTIGAKLVVTLSLDFEQHAQQAYVAPTGYNQPQRPPARQSPRSLAIAAELSDRNRYPYSQHLATTRISTGDTYREAALALIRAYKNNSDGWWALGQSIFGLERVTVSGRQMSQRDCYVEALTDDPRNSLAWYNLSLTMTAPERVVVNGETLRREECAQRGR